MLLGLSSLLSFKIFGVVLRVFFGGVESLLEIQVLSDIVEKPNNSMCIGEIWIFREMEGLLRGTQ